MVVFFEIPIIFILAILAFAIGGAYQIASNIGAIFLGLLVVIIVLGIAVLMIRVFYKINAKQGTRLSFISYISIIGFWLCGYLFLWDLNSLDLQGKYFPMFKNNEILYHLGPFIGAILVAFGILLVSYFFCRTERMQEIVGILPTIFLIVFCLASSNVCAKSYSDYTVSELSNDENLVEHTLAEDVKIYYPSELGTTFPGLLPFKYCPDTFEKGECIYIDTSETMETYWTEQKYVLATNGEKAGYIKYDY